MVKPIEVVTPTHSHPQTHPYRDTHSMNERNQRWPTLSLPSSLQLYFFPPVFQHQSSFNAYNTIINHNTSIALYARSLQATSLSSVVF